MRKQLIFGLVTLLKALCRHRGAEYFICVCIPGDEELTVSAGYRRSFIDDCRDALVQAEDQLELALAERQRKELAQAVGE